MDRSDNVGDFVRLVDSLPFELQQKIISYAFLEYTEVDLLRNVQDYHSCQLIERMLIERVLGYLSLESKSIGFSCSSIQFDSPDFENVIALITNCKIENTVDDDNSSNNAIGSLSVASIKNFKLSTINETFYQKIKILLDNSANLIANGESLTKLKWFNQQYLKKISVLSIRGITEMNLTDFKFILNYNLTQLSIVHGPIEPEEIYLLHGVFDMLQKHANAQVGPSTSIKAIPYVNLGLSMTSIDRIDYSDLPNFKIPNAEIIFELKSTVGVTKHQVASFIGEVLGFDNIISLSLHMFGSFYDDFSFLTQMPKLGKLCLIGDFTFGKVDLKIDELEFKHGVVTDLSRTIASEIIMSGTQLKDGKMAEGVDRLSMNYCQIDWHNLKLPASLTSVEIQTKTDRVTELPTTIFENLTNLSSLVLYGHIDAYGLILPSCITYFSFDFFDAIFSFGLPSHLRHLDANFEAICDLTLPNGLVTLEMAVHSTDFALCLPPNLVTLILKDYKDSLHSHCLTIKLSNITKLKVIHIEKAADKKVVLTLPEEEKRYGEKLTLNGIDSILYT